jgi:glycosyltransferase involved in cell wall biosynthesis
MGDRTITTPPNADAAPDGDARTSGRPRVAFDTGPLHGHQTGIGLAVRSTLDALHDDRRVDIQPYVVSLRSRPGPGIRKFPLPAALAHRWWRHPAPPVDRLLGSPDLVHGTNYVVPPASCPQLVSVYDCWFLDHPTDATPDVQRAADVLRRSIARGAHVVSCSDATTERVRALLDTDRVTTVALGPPDFPTPGSTVPIEPPTLRAHHGHPYVLSLGTVERRKNVPMIVAAFARLAAEHPTVRLVIAGAPGNDQAAVDAAIARLTAGVRDRIVQLGRVDPGLKGRLLRNAAALAYVSLDEGFGFPILEAQQVGVPIVASTAGSIPEVAGAAALLSSPDDTDAIAANMHLAITSEAVRAKLAAQAERNLERFSWADTARQLTDLYLSLANGSR